LAWAVAAGDLAVTEVQRSETLAAHRAAMARALLLERELLSIDRSLARRGLELVVLKGTAAAHLDEPDPSWRSFGDLDLLVRGDDIAAAVDVIVERGGARRYPEPRPGFDRRWTKGISFAFERTCDVDLHRTLAAGPFGLVLDLDELLGAQQAFEVGGRELRALDRGGRFLHAAYHGVLGSPEPRLLSLRDLVRTCPASGADLRAILARVHHHGGDVVVAAAVRAAMRILGWSPPAELAAWADHLHAPARDERWLAAYRGAHRSYARQMLDGIGAIPGVPAKLDYARALAAPVARRAGTSAGDRWRTGARALRGRSR
jgi:hypothetical protein